METIGELKDGLNKVWLSHVAPEDWTNPSPWKKYDLVVIGAGTAGLVSAGAAAILGAKVALVEKHRMGGDCLNAGCVPSKALIHSANSAWWRRQALPPDKVAFPDKKENFIAVMKNLREKRAEIAPHDSAERIAKLGVHVFFGEAVFAGPNALKVGGKKLAFRKAVVATGSRPDIPGIPGLAETPFLTNESIFNLSELPESLVVLGGGPIGVEMAQAFNRLGSPVTLIDVAPQVLIRENPQAARYLQNKLKAEGVSLFLSASVKQISHNAEGFRLDLESSGKPHTIAGSHLLVATGRAPVTKGLGLETAGIAYSESGINVDEFLRTSNKRVYACGDVASAFKFTHAADFYARQVVQNALFFGRKKKSSLLVPWVTYTDPEIAHVGLYEHEAEIRGIGFKKVKLEFSEMDRSILEGETEGFVEVLVSRGRVLGGTVVHRRAGEMISQLTLLIQNKIPLSKLSGVMYPYPTQSEIIRKLGDEYNRRRLGTAAKRILKAVLWLGRYV